MAVEATLYPPQLLSATTTTTAAETLFPMYYSSPNFTNPDPLKAESDLTYGLPPSRKRSRDSSPACIFSNAKTINRNNAFTFLGEDISLQIERQQFEIDQFVARHAENVRVDVEERRRRNTRRLISALDESITRMLMAKEAEIAKMTKLNWALEERVKSLCTENQIWRELAETNESTANALRTNLKQALEQLVHGDYDYRHRGPAAAADDAQSCCGSNNDNDDERTLAEQDSSNSMNNRMCKSCWKGESCVLLLPCRHLCVCTVCASSVHICPICKSSINISVHVHMS